MHQLPIEQQILLVVQIVLLLALQVRLWRDGLYKIYVYFFAYLLMELVQALVPVLVPFTGRIYRDSYVVSQVVVICLCALVVLELYAIIFHGLPGIGRVARRYITVALALAVLISLLPLLLEKTPDTLTGYLFVFQRPIVSTLLLCILLIMGFLVYYPVPLGRNVLVYLLGYAVFFIANATTIFIRNLGFYWTRPISDVNIVVYVICLAFWLFALNRAGEAKSVVVGHQWNPADEQRLMAQLNAINASLLRSGRK